MSAAVVGAEATVGIFLIFFLAVTLRKILLRGYERHDIRIEPWAATLLGLMCSLLLGSLLITLLKLGNKPIAFLVVFTVLTVMLARSSGLKPSIRAVTSASRAHQRALLMAVAPLLLTAAAIGVAWVSDTHAEQPVTSLSAIRTSDTVRIIVERAPEDKRALSLRIVDGASVRWASSDLGTGGAITVTVRQATGDSIQLLADGHVVRAVGVPEQNSSSPSPGSSSNAAQNGEFVLRAGS